MEDKIIHPNLYQKVPVTESNDTQVPKILS